MGPGRGPALPDQQTGRGQRFADAGDHVGGLLRPRRTYGDDGGGPPDRGPHPWRPGGLGGPAVFHELLRVALTGEDPLAAVPRTLDEVHPDHRRRWATALAPDWHPALATEFNGAVWPCLATALWALRTTDSFESALAAAVDVGGDTDTVAAVTGGLAGAVYGIDAVPDRWTTLLHVPLPGYGGRVLRTPELLGLAARLDSEAPRTTHKA